MNFELQQNMLYHDSCECLDGSFSRLVESDFLGMDDQYAEIFILKCTLCGRLWLKYLWEFEAVAASGRWYMGLIRTEPAQQLTADQSRSFLESSDWYYCCGSHFLGQIFKSSGQIFLIP